VRASSTGFPLQDPRVPPLVFSPAILYDAYAYVNSRNAHDMDMIDGECECFHMNEHFYFYFTE
jgi:hypothetical protein